MAGVAEIWNALTFTDTSKYYIDFRWLGMKRPDSKTYDAYSLSFERHSPTRHTILLLPNMMMPL